MVLCMLVIWCVMSLLLVIVCVVMYFGSVLIVSFLYCVFSFVVSVGIVRYGWFVLIVIDCGCSLCDVLLIIVL